MAKVGPAVPPGGSSGGSDDTTPIQKEKFKQKMKQVEAVEKVDPDQKAKKRKLAKSEEEDVQAQQASLNQSGQTPSLGAETPLDQSSASQGVSSVQSTNQSEEAPYTPKQGDGLEDTQSISSNPIDTDYPTDQKAVGNNPPSKEITSSEPSGETQGPLESPSSKESPQQAPLASDQEISQEQEAPLKTSADQIKPSSPLWQSGSQEKAASLQQAPLENLPSKQEAMTKETSSSKKALQGPLDEVGETKTPSTYQQPIKQEKEVSESSYPKSASKKEKKLEEASSKETRDQSTNIESLQAPVTPVPISQAPPIPAPAPPASYLSPEVHELFQTMVGLVIMKQIASEGLKGTQTEISLNNPEYESSKFYGLKIVITEYETAPGAYNIELQGDDVQTSVLTAESQKLISAFNDNRYNLPFTINRLDISLKKGESDYRFKRKGSVKGDQAGTGDQKQD